MSISSRTSACLRALSVFTILILLPSVRAAQDVDVARPEEALQAARARLAALPEDDSATDWRAAVEKRIGLLGELLATRRDEAAFPTAESLTARLTEATAAVDALRSQTTQPVALTDADELSAFEQAVGNATARQKTSATALADFDTRRSEAETELQELGQRSADAKARGSVAVDPASNEIGAYRASTARLEVAVASERELYLGAGQPVWDSLRDALAAEAERAQLELERAQERLDLARAQAAELRAGQAERARQDLGRIFAHFVEPLAGAESRGEQLAWLTLTRYGILTAAWAGALLTLRVDLGTLGWLLTAVSVGLGFGLQEIVANFVSGLILLFEKPIRVGDVITVGSTGGTVDRITIRSTVVTNWERQTIFIPNKKFITQDLTNWTRHDATVRRKLRVGVARGTDVERSSRSSTRSWRGTLA